MAFTDASYGLFQGTLYAAPRLMNGPQTGGFLNLGDCDALEITPTQKYEDIEESISGLGLSAAHIPTSTQLKVKMNLRYLSAKNWVTALWGSYGNTVTGATVAAEPVNLYNGAMTPLANPGVSAVVVTKTAGSLVLVLGTDYTLDAVNGTITVLPASALVASATVATPCTVAYTFAAWTGRIDAFTTGQIVLKLRLNGINTANSNQPTLVNIYQFVPDIAKSLKMIEKKSASLELDGMLLQDTTIASAVGVSQFFQILKA